MLYSLSAMTSYGHANLFLEEHWQLMGAKSGCFWLGRVLAGRGMPTFLLADQLEILVEELAAAIPEKKSAYEKLLPAAAELRESRRRHLTDAQIQAIATGFDRAVGPEWSARFPHTGTLLGCAVADELEGSELAVESLRPWMTDATRFPAAWIVTVEATLAQARAGPAHRNLQCETTLNFHEQEAGESCRNKNPRRARQVAARKKKAGEVYFVGRLRFEITTTTAAWRRGTCAPALHRARKSQLRPPARSCRDTHPPTPQGTDPPQALDVQAGRIRSALRDTECVVERIVPEPRTETCTPPLSSLCTSRSRNSQPSGGSMR